MNELVKMFKYWNNRGKSAICRYILQELDISLQEFSNYTEDWKERKVVKNERGEYEVKIEHDIKI